MATLNRGWNNEGEIMNAVKSVLIVFAVLACTALSTKAQTSPITTRISPHDIVSAHLGRRGALMVIVYGRPYSKDPHSDTIRKIWGGLVPWGKVWRTGADEATLMIIG